MRQRHLAIIVLAVLSVTVAVTAQETKANKWSNWSRGTAYTMPKGRMEIGVFHPLRYGWSQSLELSTHPLTDILMPNLSAKWAHGSLGGFGFSTRHSFYYPTLLLRLVSKEGIAGMISPEFDIPHMFSFYNEALLSAPIFNNHLITGKAGFGFAIKSGDLDDRSTIDLPLIFPRLAVFYNDYGFRFGGVIKGQLIKRWNYCVDADLFLSPGAEENMAFEHKGLILWTKSKRFQLFVGYKLSYGEYPFGTQWHLLAPLFDLQWARQLK